MDYRIQNMTCGGCVRGVTAAIRAVDPDAELEARPEDRFVRITSKASRQSIEQALVAAGFPPEPVSAA